jgi:hypothetical protein
MWTRTGRTRRPWSNSRSKAHSAAAVGYGAQGIHIGLSRRGDRSHLKAGTLLIQGNTIYSLRPPLVTRESMGIFPGNAQSSSIGENVVIHTPLRRTTHLETIAHRR